MAGQGATGNVIAALEYATQLTEVMLLGIVSLRAGGKIHYDAANMKVTNEPEADQYVQHTYRQGWAL